VISCPFAFSLGLQAIGVNTAKEVKGKSVGFAVAAAVVQKRYSFWTAGAVQSGENEPTFQWNTSPPYAGLSVDRSACYLLYGYSFGNSSFDPEIRGQILLRNISRLQRKTRYHIPGGGNTQRKIVRFEVFMAMTMKNGVFWDVTPCGSCKNRRFGGT
jgi:hypothetical protein